MRTIQFTARELYNLAFGRVDRLVFESMIGETVVVQRRGQELPDDEYEATLLIRRAKGKDV